MHRGIADTVPEGIKQGLMQCTLAMENRLRQMSKPDLSPKPEIYIAEG